MRFTPFIAALAFCTSTLPAQVGGRMEQQYRRDGNTIYNHIGTTLGVVGDINADGYDDFIIGARANGPNYSNIVLVLSGLDNAILHVLNPQGESTFGSPAAGAGDINADGIPDFLVGAPMAAGPGGALTGSVTAFSGADGSVLFRKYGTNALDHFGETLAGVGDLNNDGHDDVMIGSPGFDVPGFQYSAGTTYAYSGIDGSELYKFDGNKDAQGFGTLLGAFDDVDNDGVADLFVCGGHRMSVFSGASGLPIYTARHLEVNGLTGSFCLGPDSDGDGIRDFLVGNKETWPGGVHLAGSVFGFSGATGELLLRWDGTHDHHRFGTSISVLFDSSGAEEDYLLIGSEGTNSRGVFYAGSVSIFSMRSRQLVFSIDGQQAISLFGTSVVGLQQRDANGHLNFVVGAPDFNSIGSLDAGSVNRYSLEPFCVADRATVSRTSGAVVNLDMDFPSSAAGYSYRTLMSVTGVGPTPLVAVDIPLTIDPWFLRSSAGNYPFSSTAGLVGTLDAQGNSQAQVAISLGFSPALIGRKIWMAVVASPALGPAEFSSVVVGFKIVP